MLRLGRRSTWRPPPRRRSLERPHLDLPIADLRRLGGQLERHIQIGCLPHPDAGEVLLGLQKGPVAEHRLLAPVVDDRGRVGVRESARENPVALGDQSFVERADGRLSVRAAGVALVVYHGNQILHPKIISCGVKTAWPHPCYEHLRPDPTAPPGISRGLDHEETCWRTTATTATLPKAVRENQEVVPVNVSTWVLPSG